MSKPWVWKSEANAQIYTLYLERIMQSVLWLLVTPMSSHNQNRLVQVQEKKGDKYETLKPKEGHELLLVVSWYEGFLACNNEGSPNQVTFMLMSKKILITRKEDVWKLKPQFIYCAAEFEVCDQPVPGTFFSWRPQVLVRALPQQGERGQTGCWSGKGRRPFCKRSCLCKCSFDTRLPGLTKIVFWFLCP